MLTNLLFFNDFQIKSSFQLHSGSTENHTNGSRRSPLFSNHFPEIFRGNFELKNRGLFSFKLRHLYFFRIVNQ